MEGKAFFIPLTYYIDIIQVSQLHLYTCSKSEMEPDFPTVSL